MQSSKESVTRSKPVPILPEVREGRTWSTVSNQSTSLMSMRSQTILPSRKLKTHDIQTRLKRNLGSQSNVGTGSVYSSTDAGGKDGSHQQKRRESLYFGKSVRTAMWWLYRRPEELVSTDRFTVSTENTFRTEPKTHCKFLTTKVEDILHDTMSTHGDFLKLNNAAEGAADFVQFLATAIKERVKSLEFDRYRLIVHVQMGTSVKDDLLAASRCLWNVETDKFANVTFRYRDAVVVLTVYGVYFE